MTNMSKKHLEIWQNINPKLASCSMLILSFQCFLVGVACK